MKQKLEKQIEELTRRVEELEKAQKLVDCVGTEWIQTPPPRGWLYPLGKFL